MSTCRELAEFLADYLENSLAAEQRAEFERHLRMCPSCVAYLNTYRQTIELSRRAYGSGDSDPPAEIPDELVRAILAARGKQH